jgi:hypothetical protein
MNFTCMRKNLRRRDVLKTGSSSLGLFAFGNLQSRAGSNEQTRDKTFRQHLQVANEIGRQGGPEARAEYLRKNNYPTAYAQCFYAVENSDAPLNSARQSEKFASTQRADCVEPDKCEGSIGLGLHLTYNCNDNYHVASCSVKLQCHDGFEDPVDGVGIQWNDNHWLMKYGSDADSHEGDEYIEWDNGSASEEGTAFRVNDKGLNRGAGGCYQEGKWSEINYATVYIEKGPNHGEGPEDEDKITASYLHTWEGRVYSFGVAYPWGISISSGSEVRSEDLQTDLNGEELKIYASDAEAGSGCRDSGY